MKVRIAITEKIESKLRFVKIIKSVTGLGLREAKDIVDHLCDNQKKTVEIDINKNFELEDWNSTSKKTFDSLSYLKEEIKHCGGKILINGGEQWHREYKMLSIGVGELDDYHSFLKDYILINPDFMKNILEKIKKEELQQLISEIENK